MFWSKRVLPTGCTIGSSHPVKTFPVALHCRSRSSIMNRHFQQLQKDGPVVYPANAFHSRLRGDQVPLGSSPTKSQKERLSPVRGLSQDSCDLHLISCDLLTVVFQPEISPCPKLVLDTRVQRDHCCVSRSRLRSHNLSPMFSPFRYLKTFSG